MIRQIFGREKKLSDEEINEVFAQTDHWSSQNVLSQHAMMRKEAEMASQLYKAAAAQGSYLGGLTGHAGLTGGAAHPQNTAGARYSLVEKLHMRLNVDKYSSLPFTHIHAVENPEGGNVVIFIIQGGKPVTLEDDLNLFPSDRLISQLNLIRS